MITSSLAQNTKGGDYIFCAHQMLSLIPAFQKIGVSSQGAEHWRTIAAQVGIMEKRLKVLQTYCSLTAPNMSNISTANATPDTCVSAASTFYQTVQPMIGRPSTVTQDLQIFQLLLNQLPTLKGSCGVVVDPYEYYSMENSNEGSNYEDSISNEDLPDVDGFSEDGEDIQYFLSNKRDEIIASKY